MVLLALVAMWYGHASEAWLADAADIGSSSYRLRGEAYLCSDRRIPPATTLECVSRTLSPRVEIVMLFTATRPCHPLDYPHHRQASTHKQA